MEHREQEEALETKAGGFNEERVKARMGKARAMAKPTWPTYSATDVVNMVSVFGIALITEASNP